MLVKTDLVNSRSGITQTRVFGHEQTGALKLMGKISNNHTEDKGKSGSTNTTGYVC